jgi:flagellar biosynthesis/type III secretory pathway ATPase
VAEARGTLIRATGVNARIGEVCELREPGSARILIAEVVGIERGTALLTPLGTLDGLSSNTEVVSKGLQATVLVGDGLRTVDAQGNVIDGRPAPIGLYALPVYRDAPNAMLRAPVKHPFHSAEYFRDQGKRVLLLLDSVTRFARALRDVGLAVGEPPARRGYPPSVFAALPRLFERTGNNDKGSITAFYTVLLEDEESDPIGEEVRSILDGYVYLSRKLAAASHFPAIDVLASASRVMPARDAAGASARRGPAAQAYGQVPGHRASAADRRIQAWLGC